MTPLLVLVLALLHLTLGASILTPIPDHRHRSSPVTSPPPTAAVNSYPISDATLGPIFDGVGAISGGGSTSRLLLSYSPSILAEVYDFLFRPDFGAAFHWLKVEIGGEGLSSEGSEATHARTEAELQSSPNYRRGYEWALMVAAKRLNPSIRLYGLAWTWPGFLGRANPYTNVSLTAQYSTSWVQGAKSVYGLDIDVLGVWNERAYSAPYILALRQQLDDAGFPNTHILCDDSSYQCAADILKDPALSAAVTYLGGHSPATAQAHSTGKSVWFSEDFHSQGGEPGGAIWAGQINTRYVQYNMTATLAWNIVDSFYRGLTFDDTGLMNARCPWGNSYEVLATIWATAHTTQFTRPGWRYTRINTGSANLMAGGSVVTYVETASGAPSNFTVVIEKFSRDGRGAANETAEFCLNRGGGLQWAFGEPLRVWQSTFDRAGTTPSYFQRLSDVMVDNSTGCFQLDVPLDSVTTVTTLTTGGKGTHPDPPPCPDFPLPYSDDFEHCVPPAEADYFHDVSGSWECIQEASDVSAHGTVMRLQSVQKPVSWEPSADTTPVGVVGDQGWTDVNVTVDVRLNSATDSFMLGVRANLHHYTNYTALQLEYIWPGLWLSWDATGAAALQDLANHAAVIQAVKLPVAPAVGEWHTYTLVVKGQQWSGWQDGKVIFSGVEVGTYFPEGWVGYGTQKWGDHPDFDNFRVEKA